MKKLINEVKDFGEQINWTIIIAMIAVGISSGIIIVVIALYFFAAYAHIKSAFNNAIAFLWQ